MCVILSKEFSPYMFNAFGMPKYIENCICPLIQDFVYVFTYVI